MAFVPAQVAGAHVHTTGAGTVASGAATYTNGRVYVAVVGGSGVTSRTCTGLSGASGTWAEVNAGADSTWNDGTNWAVTAFTASNATGAAQQLTGTFSGAWGTSTFIDVVEIPDGFDLSGLVVTSDKGATVGAGGSGGTTAAVADSAAAGNMRLCYIVHRVQESMTAGNGGTLVGETSVASPSCDKAFWYRVGSATADPSVTYSSTTRGAGWVYLELKAAAGGITGTAAWTEGADTATGSGTFSTTGTSAWTEGADTATGTGSFATTGTGAWTEGADTCAASGWILVTGTAAWTEGADTCVASGAVVNFTGPASWTEAADTATGSGAFTTTGTAAWTEGADTASGSGWILVTGTVAWTEGADTCAASGALADFVGTVAWTEGADTCAGSGTSTTTGTAAWTEGADTCTASGTFTTTGTAAWTEGADTCTASGTSANFLGTASWTEAADTCAASGTFSIGLAFITVTDTLLRPDMAPDRLARVKITSGTDVTYAPVSALGIWSADLTPGVYKVTVRPSEGPSASCYISVPSSAGPHWIGDILTSAP